MQFSIRSSHFYFRMPFILPLAPYSVELILPYACTGAIASYLTSSPVSLLSHILYTSSRVILLNTTFISHQHSTSPFTPHPHPPNALLGHSWWQQIIQTFLPLLLRSNLPLLLSFLTTAPDPTHRKDSSVLLSFYSTLVSSLWIAFATLALFSCTHFQRCTSNSIFYFNFPLPISLNVDLSLSSVPVVLSSNHGDN